MILLKNIFYAGASSVAIAVSGAVVPSSEIGAALGFLGIAVTGVSTLMVAGQEYVGPIESADGVPEIFGGIIGGTLGMMMNAAVIDPVPAIIQVREAIYNSNYSEENMPQPDFQFMVR